VIVAGGVLMSRDQGKACFAELQDSEGRIQLYLNRDVLCPEDDKTMYNQVFKKIN
jgi:lysyl-tRNA synthetase class 2